MEFHSSDSGESPTHIHVSKTDDDECDHTKKIGKFTFNTK